MYLGRSFIAGAIMHLTALFYLIPLVLITLAVIRRMRTGPPEHVRPVTQVAVFTMLITSVFAGFMQPYLGLWRLPAHVNGVIKDVALVLNALGVVTATDLFLSGHRKPALGLRFGFAASVVAATMAWLDQRVARWPNIPVMMFSVWSYGYAVTTFAHYTRNARNLLTRWRFRTLTWGFSAACLYAVGRVWIVPVVPVPVRFTLGIVNRTTLSLAAILVYLGFVTPRWWALLGTRLEVLWRSRLYHDHLLALVGLLHDLQLEVQQPQRAGLIRLAERLALQMGVSQEVLTVVRTTAAIAPVKFSKYNDRYSEIPPLAPTGGGEAARWDPVSAFESFSAAYLALKALMGPGHLPQDAPLEARIVRAAELHLDGATIDEIAAETSSEVASALAHLLDEGVPNALDRGETGHV